MPAGRYVRTGDMVKHRWYPTLAELPNGDILAASGPDEFIPIFHLRTAFLAMLGRMLPGATTNACSRTRSAGRTRGVCNSPA
jgi:hypothetical protein